MLAKVLIALYALFAAAHLVVLPFDEGLVRCAVLALAFVFLYAALSGAARLVRWFRS